MAKDTKFIFVTGGVLSSLGKGLASAAMGALLESRGLTVTIQKLDPYINVDPGTMNPFQHGEVFVTDDGTETGYFFVRATLARTISEAAQYIAEKGIAKEGAPVLVRLIAVLASRFGVIVSEKVAAQAIPLIGADAEGLAVLAGGWTRAPSPDPGHHSEPGGAVVGPHMLGHLVALGFGFLPFGSRVVRIRFDRVTDGRERCQRGGSTGQRHAGHELPAILLERRVTHYPLLPGVAGLCTGVSRPHLVPVLGGHAEIDLFDLHEALSHHAVANHDDLFLVFGGGGCRRSRCR